MDGLIKNGKRSNTQANKAGTRRDGVSALFEEGVLFYEHARKVCLLVDTKVEARKHASTKARGMRSMAADWPAL